MQIPPGDPFPRTLSGFVAQPTPLPRQTPPAPTQPHGQAPTPTAARLTAAAPNSPPPADRAHAVERIANGPIPRDVPRGSILDIQA